MERITVRVVIERKGKVTEHEFSGSPQVAQLNAYRFISGEQPVTVRAIVEASS